MAALALSCACAPATHRDPPAPQPPAAKAAPQPAAIRPKGDLPEDPAAGAASTAQWREHMRREEEERRMLFDKNRIPQHRAAIRLLKTTRAELDRAKTDRALAKAEAQTPEQLSDLRKRVTAIDKWGVSSKLLPDYAALEAMLSGPYPNALRAARRGDKQELTALRESFDERIEHMNEWLERAERGEDEEEEEEEAREAHGRPERAR